MGAKEGQGWALGTAFVGWSEGVFGDKVDLDLLWKDCISSDATFFFLLKTPRSEIYKAAFNNECREWWEQGYLCDFIFNSPCPLKSCA